MSSVQYISRCQFCGKRYTTEGKPVWQDKNWQCQICQFYCCGECIKIHLEKAHPAQARIYNEFKYLLENGKVVFLPWRKS